MSCRPQEIIFSTGLLSLDSQGLKGGREGERERDQKPTNLVASRANREDKEAGGQGLSLCSFHHCSEVTGGLARPC